MKYLIMTLCVSVFLLNVAIAETYNKWDEDKVRLEKLTEIDACDQRWTILWNWAKEGNLEARFMIFFLMAPPPDMNPLRAPGNNGDVINTLNDTVIFAAHSIDYKGDFPGRDQYKSVALELFNMIGLTKGIGGKKFIECINRNESVNCSKLAVEENLIPSFDEYASKIDLFISHGHFAHCE